jgi:CRISPR-associated protein Cas5d
MSDNFVSVRVWGDFACFTRPEMKVERVSYPVVTPSAARGILEAIFWEPQMYYVIDSIRVIKKGRWISFRRNEVISQVSMSNAMTWMKSPEKFAPIQAGGGAPDGTQRNMLALQDVEYVITAQVLVSGIGHRAGQNLTKYLSEIERRTKQGKCFHRPALGVREFAADFEWEPDPQEALERRGAEVRNDRDWRKIWAEEELGIMLYDVFDHRQRAEGFRWLSVEEMRGALSVCEEEVAKLPKGKRKSSSKQTFALYEGLTSRPQAVFFNAKIKDARMVCHPGRVEMIARPLVEA